MPDFDDDLPEEASGPSKTALKRQMTELQALGESLTRMSDKDLARVPVEDPQLMQAILETRRIKSNSARKRHLQYIGKLMRDIDPVPLQAALDELYRPQRERNDAFHALEGMRDDLLAKGLPAVEDVLARWPDADRQQLRQLLLQQISGLLLNLQVLTCLNHGKEDSGPN